MQTQQTKIAVAGATGRVGRHVVDVLGERGYDVVPMSRASGVDVITGAGLAEALVGVTAVIDTATGPSPEKEAATTFFTTAAHHLQAAGQQAGVQRLVVVSIIGCDQFTSGYGAAKLAHERVTTQGPIAGRVLRAAQFHEFVGQLVDWGRQGPVAYVPEMRTQLVAARTVAEVLVDMATEPAWAADMGAPIAEIAGPREESLIAAATQLMQRRGDPVRIEGVRDASDPDGALNLSGALLPHAHAMLRGPTFATWLAAQPAA
jgi:uncharacterized protein YbjT (DUF2867 family)